MELQAGCVLSSRDSAHATPPGRARARAGRREDALHVRLDHFGSDRQLARHGLIGKPFGDQPQDFVFPRASAPAEFVDAPAAGPWARRRRSGSRSRRARGGGILPPVRRLVKLRQQRVRLRSLIKDDLADTVFRGHCRDGGKFVWAIRDLPRTPRQYRQVHRYPGCQVAAACALAFLPQVLQEGTRLIQAVLRRGEIGPRQKGVAMNVGPGAARGYGISASRSSRSRQAAPP